MAETQDIGLVGLAVMGQNLVLNMSDHGFSVAVFNRTTSKMEKFVAGPAAGREIVGYKTIEEFVAGLKTPRKIMLMVKAGKPVDDFIEMIKPHLDKGDLLIDGGNSHFPDTIRRCKALAEEGYLYIGTGVSGGEEGARMGPSIMPGGSREAYALVEDVLTAISAKIDGETCCTYIGDDGGGHYVKMVHNGIEYGDMQMICEAYFLMKEALGMDAAELHEVFAKWNEGLLDSYLIEITRDIFGTTDPATGDPLVEKILDKAGQKGTGKWTSQSALDLGTPAATIAEAVFARCISAVKDERVAASKVLKGPDAKFEGDKAEFVNAIHDALYASKICSYAQGFALMRDAAAEYDWTLEYGPISMIWRGGCIIRAKFLQKIKDAFDHNPKLANLMLDPFFKDAIEKAQTNWRKVVATAAMLGIPVPAFSSALAYYDSYRRATLSANLIQAQRDYFGAHSYKRTDQPMEKTFHFRWFDKEKREESW